MLNSRRTAGASSTPGHPDYTLGTDPAMTDTVDNLILDLVEWVERQERTYRETMDAWRTSCPRLPVWEDACDRGFVEGTAVNAGVVVRATPAGLAFLKENRPDAYEELKGRAIVSSDGHVRDLSLPSVRAAYWPHSASFGEAV
jgi:hypothetical protein